MTNFERINRDKAVEACTSFLKKGHNVENTVAIIALGFLMDELDNDEINKIINSNFLLKEGKIAELIMSYVEKKWNEENNELYADFVLVRDHYSGSALQYMRKVDMEIICKLWDECMQRMGAPKKENNKKVNYLNWSISLLSVIGLISIFMASLSNNPFQNDEINESSEEIVQKEFTDEQVNLLLELVGGDEKYTEIMKWAQENISEYEMTKFDQIIDSVEFEQARQAILNLKAKYDSK